MSGHSRSSSTVVTSSVMTTSIQPRFQVFYPDKNDENNQYDDNDDRNSQQYPEHDYEISRTSQRVTSEQYTTNSSTYVESTGYYVPAPMQGKLQSIQQQQTSQHYVIPPSPKEYQRPKTPLSNYVDPPSPKEYTPPNSYSQHYVIPPEPREYIEQTKDVSQEPPVQTENRLSGAVPPRNTLTEDNPILPDGADAAKQRGPGSEVPGREGGWVNVDLKAVASADSARDGDNYDGSAIEKGIQEIILNKDDRGKLGVKTRSIKKGIYVMDVVVGSPAAVAGLLPGDRILKVNGINVDSFDDEKMHDIFKKMPVKGIRLLINKKPLEKTLTIQKNSKGRLGIKLRSTKIHQVLKGSNAEIVGLSTDHYLIEVNGTKVRGMKEEEIRKLMDYGTCVNVVVMPYFLYEPLMKQIPIR